jgi:hypothetical protein
VTPRLLALLLAASIASSAAAQTDSTRWTTNRVGNSVYYSNDKGERGQAWETAPGTIHSETQDQRGHVTYCDTRRFGNAIERTCH